MIELKYPLFDGEKVSECVRPFPENAPIGHEENENIAHKNVETLLKL